MRIGRGNAAGTAKAFLWRALPWVPVAWCVDDAVVSVRRIDRPGIKVVAALSDDFDDDRCREGAYAMLDKASYRYFSNVERGDVVCMPRPGSFYSSETRSFSGTKRREGGQMEMQRVVALENDLVAWKETNAKTGGEEMKDALVPKGHCFIASEREEVEHVGIVPVGLIEAKVPYAVTVGGDRGGFFPGVNAIGISKTSLTTPIDSGRRVVVRRRYF